MNAIEIKALKRSFGDFTLGPLDLVLPSGCILGLIGENGAGKSTTIKLLLGMLKADSGSSSMLVQTLNPQLKEDIGVVLDEPGLPYNLTLKKVDRIMSGIYKNWSKADFAALTKRLSLPENKAYKEFSRGMKMKLGLAIAMSHKPRLLLLDEATSGLDPVVRDDVTELLLDFTRDEGHSILISSHIVSDLEKLCDYIAFLHKGQLMLLEEKDVLLEEYCLLNCALEDVERIEPAAILGRQDSAYGARLLLRREVVPAGMSASPVSIEELFIFMVKGNAK